MSKNRVQIPSLSIKGGNVVGVINASGSSRVNVNQKIIHQATPEMEKLFKQVHREIKRRHADPALDPEKVEQQVRKIEAEAAKGKAADPSRLERWMKSLGKMAPGILEVMAASLAGPVAGFTAVFKQIVARALAGSAER
jgi:hypothetical protein